MERYWRPPSGPNAEQDSLRPTIALFRRVSERNHARARRRFLRARYLNPQSDIAEAWEDYVHQVDPSDDESIPADSQDLSA